ncbi:MAG: transposase [Saprospiraceae bacterium]|nr:transposase [Saprospiraceae bacterium]
MATTETYKKLTVQERQNRYFSEEFRRKKVREIERNITTIAEVCREYQVSGTSVRKWLYKYSAMRKKGIKQVIEAKSDTRKLQQLKDQIKELEQIIGQKQLLIDFQQKVIEQTEKEYSIDIKKKFGDKAYYGSGTTKNNTTTK